MSKVSHIVIDGFLYDVQTLTAETLGEFIKDVPRYELNAVLKNYPDIKKGKKL